MPLSNELLPVLHAVTGVVRDETVHDLTTRQLAVLLTLANHDSQVPLGVRELHEKLATAKPVITRACTLLESLQMISRKPDPKDKRLVNLRITPGGLTYIRRMSKHLKQAA